MELPIDPICNAYTHALTQIPASLIRVGSILCRLEVWSEAEYHRHKEDQHLAAAEFRSGLGWVVALPVDPAK